jgi:hypothetical protein
VSGSAEQELPAGVADALRGVGCNLLGRLSRERWDALVPDAWSGAALLPAARSVWLVASGGGAFFQAFSRAPESRLPRDPLDAFTRRVVEAAAAALPAACRAVFPFEQRGGRYADFVALARVIHRHYGPWWALRAALLTSLELPASPEPPPFDPCRGCPAPCVAACPGGAVQETFRVGACLETRRREPGCRLACAARRACVVGPEHAYPEEEEAHHMRHAHVWPGLRAH